MISGKKNVRNVRNRTIAKCHILYTQGGETICRCAQATANKGLQEPKTGHMQKISVEENPWGVFG